MIGLRTVASWGFWILLVAGWMLGELHFKGTVVFLLLWAAVFAGSTWLFPAPLFVPLLALLDIALVFAIFKGDVALR